MKTFGERMAFARQMRGLMQKDLAEAMKVTASFVSHFESDRRKPSYESLEAIADALKVSVDWLMGRVTELGPQGRRLKPLRLS